MTARQKIELRQSALRKQVGEMLAVEAEARVDTFEADLAKATAELRQPRG